MGATLALFAASTAMNFWGAHQAQQGVNAEAAYNASALRNNAQAAIYRGQYTKEASIEEARREGIRTRQFIGSQRAAQGASGVVADEGTFLDLQLDAAEHGKLQQLQIIHQGDLAVWESEVESANLLSQAQFQESRIDDSSFLESIGNQAGEMLGSLF